MKCCDEVHPVAKVMCYLSLINYKVYDHLGVLKHFLSYMNDLSTLYHLSQSIGAANCIIRRQNDGKLFGYNTDYVGAISAIEDGLRGIYCLRKQTFFF